MKRAAAFFLGVGGQAAGGLGWQWLAWHDRLRPGGGSPDGCMPIRLYTRFGDGARHGSGCVAVCAQGGGGVVVVVVVVGGGGDGDAP